MKDSVNSSYTKSYKRWTAFSWFLFGLILFAGIGYATTINEGGVFNAGQLTFGNTTGTYGETAPNRPLVSNYDTNFTVCASGCDYTTIQDAVNQVPYILRHKYWIIINDGTYNENVFVQPIINDRRDQTEGAIAGLSIRGNTSNVNGAKVDSFQFASTQGTHPVIVSYLNIFGSDETSDEGTSFSAYGANVLGHHLNFTNESVNYAVMSYESNLEIHTSSFSGMDYAGLAKVMGHLRMGDTFGGSSINGSLGTAIARSDDSSFVYLENILASAPKLSDGQGLTMFGNITGSPQIIAYGGEIYMGTAGDADTIIKENNITTRMLEVHRGQYNSFLTNNNNPLIYGAGGSGSYPFTTTGNLIIQPRTSTQDADIIFAVGDNTPDIPLIVDGANGGGIIIGNVSTGTAPPLIVVRNTTAKTCSLANAGGIYYDNNAFRHYGCNSTTWNALY